MFESILFFRRRLAAGQFCLGSGITLADPAVVEALAESIDFFWIDLEHSHLGHETLQGHLIAARAGNKPALVRVPSSDIAHIKPVLDIGADGIIVPQIRSADETRTVVDACRYPPLGQRGFGPRRVAGYGRADAPEYVAAANAAVFVAVQIENVEALAELDAILAVEQLDSIVIGPFDLSFSMGHPCAPTHPEVAAAIETIIAKGRAAGKFVGMGMGANEVQAERAIRSGVQWLQCGDDYGYMVQRADKLVARIRGRAT